MKLFVSTAAVLLAYTGSVAAEKASTEDGLAGQLTAIISGMAHLYWPPTETGDPLPYPTEHAPCDCDDDTGVCIASTHTSADEAEAVDTGVCPLPTSTSADENEDKSTSISPKPATSALDSPEAEDSDLRMTVVEPALTNAFIPVQGTLTAHKAYNGGGDQVSETVYSTIPVPVEHVQTAYGTQTVHGAIEKTIHSVVSVPSEKTIHSVASVPAEKTINNLVSVPAEMTISNVVSVPIEKTVNIEKTIHIHDTVHHTAHDTVYSTLRETVHKVDTVPVTATAIQTSVVPTTITRQDIAISINVPTPPAVTVYPGGQGAPPGVAGAPGAPGSPSSSESPTSTVSLIPLQTRINTYDYKGCYKYNASDNILVGGEVNKQKEHASANLYFCATEVCKRSYFVGLSQGNQCFCGAEIQAAAVKVNDSECNTKCANTLLEAPCGGNKSIFGVYENTRGKPTNATSSITSGGVVYQPSGWWLSVLMSVGALLSGSAY